jgi:hypothetical protein
MPLTQFPIETDQPRVDVTLPLGIHVLELRVVDSGGIVSEPDRVTIVVERAEEEARIDSIAPSSVTAGARVEVTVRGRGLRGADRVEFSEPRFASVEGSINSERDEVLTFRVRTGPVSEGPMRLTFTIRTASGTVLNSGDFGVTFTVVPGRLTRPPVTEGPITLSPFTLGPVTVGPVIRPPLTDVTNIGAARSVRLEEAGIADARALAEADPTRVAEALKVSEVRARAFIEAARRLPEP